VVSTGCSRFAPTWFTTNWDAGFSWWSMTEGGEKTGAHGGGTDVEPTGRRRWLSGVPGLRAGPAAHLGPGRGPELVLTGPVFTRWSRVRFPFSAAVVPEGQLKDDQRAGLRGHGPKTEGSVLVVRSRVMSAEYCRRFVRVVG